MKKKNPLISPTLKEKRSIMTIILFVILVIYVLALFIPIIWATYTSFNDMQAYRRYALFNGEFPTKLTFENFKIAIADYRFHSAVGNEYSFGDLIMNSVIYTFGSAFFYTLTPCLVAYCAARFKFKFSKVLYAFVIITMSLPIVGAMPSELRMLKTLGIYDTFFGMFVLRMNFLSINFLIFYAQFQMIPMTYSEAAKVDGASNFRIMTTVVLPQAIPTIFTIFLLSFINFWNDYLIPRIYMPSNPTVSEGLFLFSTPNQPSPYKEIPVQLAGFIGLTLPIVVIFALLNKFLKINVATGGIKG